MCSCVLLCVRFNSFVFSLLYFSFHRTVKKRAQYSTEDDFFTIKAAFPSRCKKHLLKDFIQNEIVPELSALATEAGIYIQYCLRKKWANGEFPTEKIKFLDYFYQLVAKSKRDKYPIDEEYAQLRQNHGLRPLYSNAYSRNPMFRLAQTYETAFINNIGQNAWKRLFDFCRKFENDGKIIYATLHHLCVKDSTEIPNDRLLFHMRFFLDWNGEKIHNIEYPSGYWMHIELLYKLQYFNHVNGHKNFKLCPTARFGLRHIRIDTTALIHLVNGSKAGKSNIFKLIDSVFSPSN